MGDIRRSEGTSKKRLKDEDSMHHAAVNWKQSVINVIQTGPMISVTREEQALLPCLVSTK